MPLLVITIFEAHALLALDGARAIAEDIGKMSRKCGIKLRLETQVPLLDQLGNSTTLRDMVVSGNVVVFRTANRLTGQVAFNGNLPVDPASHPEGIPRARAHRRTGHRRSRLPPRRRLLHHAVSGMDGRRRPRQTPSPGRPGTSTTPSRPRPGNGRQPRSRHRRRNPDHSRSRESDAPESEAQAGTNPGQIVDLLNGGPMSFLDLKAACKKGRTSMFDAKKNSSRTAV